MPAVALLVHRHDALGAEVLAHAPAGRLRHRARAAPDRSAARSRSAAISSSASGGCRKPLTPCSITSGSPPTRDATTGTSHAIASSAARPKLSCADGSRKTSLIDSSGTTSSCAPTTCDQLARCRARAPADTPSPAPDRRRPAAAAPAPPGGCDRRSPITASMRLTGRKFETCMTIFTSGSPPLNRRRSSGGACAPMDGAVEKVRDDLDVARHAELRVGGRAQALATRPSRGPTARSRTPRSPSTTDRCRPA